MQNICRIYNDIQFERRSTWHNFKIQGGGIKDDCIHLVYSLMYKEKDQNTVINNNILSMYTLVFGLSRFLEKMGQSPIFASPLLGRIM